MRNIKERTRSWWKQNTPNLITTVGIIISLLFIRSILIEPAKILKITFYAFLTGLTDFIDGPAARILKSESVIGTHLDKLRDKIFVCPGIILLGWQYKEEVFIPELLVVLLISLAIFEIPILWIGIKGFLCYSKGRELNIDDLKPNEFGRRKIFAEFSVIFVWLIYLNLPVRNQLIKYFFWGLIYFGLSLSIYWAWVSWKEYAEKQRRLKKKILRAI